MTQPSGLQREWYVWRIKVGKFDIVARYIEESIPEVTEVLYPTVVTEKRTSKGTFKERQVPLYAGYLFLCYHHDLKNPTTWWKLNKHPFITKYVGPCSEGDLEAASSVKHVRRARLEASKDFVVGDRVLVNGGVFKGFEGNVLSVSTTSIKVEVKSLDRALKVVFSPEDLDIIDRNATEG